jgi:hypothetical protein
VSICECACGGMWCGWVRGWIDIWADVFAAGKTMWGDDQKPSPADLPAAAGAFSTSL